VAVDIGNRRRHEGKFLSFKWANIEISSCHVCQPQRPVRKYLNVKEMLDEKERIFLVSLTSSDWMRPHPTEAGDEHDQKNFHFHW
jgi:hypothetical protein